MIIPVILLSCYSEKEKLYGSWESILIENKSSLFAKTLPSSARGEIILILTEDEKFTWINKTEKLNLSGKYISGEGKIFFNIFNIDEEIKPLKAEFRLQNNRLIIITEDGFTFTFIKND